MIALALPLMLPSVLRAQELPTSAPLSDSTVAVRVDEYFERLAGSGYDGGVLVVRGDRRLVEKGYGFANRSAGIRADKQTVFNLGSITKQFTAAAILRLEEQGKLRTTDSIRRFFPSAPADKRDITLHQLLTHTAGFASDFSPTDYEPTTRDEYMRRMLASTLRTAPGRAHFYSNAGYSMLAAIVEIVTGEEYETALTRLVLAPAGMRETGYKAPHWASSRLAHGTQNGGDWGTIAERVAGAGQPYWALRGNGGLGTTLGDMARWDAALRGDAVLADSSRRKFMTGYVNEGPDGRSQYAYGWAVMRSSRGTRIVTHNGGNGIFVAEWIRFLDDSVTIFVASTNAAMTASPAVRTVSRIVFGQPYELPPQRVAITPASLTRVTGSYAVPGGGQLVLRVAGGKLLADPSGQGAWALLNGGALPIPGAAQLSATARTIVDALVKGDAAPLHALVDGGPPLAEMQRQEQEMMAGRRARWGALRSVEVLGTVGDAEAFAATTVRLTFERAAATNIYAWNEAGRIVDLRARPCESTELVPLGVGEFETLGAQGAAPLHLRLDGGVLVARLAGGAVRLVRAR